MQILRRDICDTDDLSGMSCLSSILGRFDDPVIIIITNRRHRRCCCR